MKKGLFLLATSSALATGLSGCASPPEPPAKASRTLPSAEAPAEAPSPPLLCEKFQKRFEKIVRFGGLAVIGTAESRSTHIAINRAKARGRIKLTSLLEARVTKMKEDFAGEAGFDPTDPLLTPFDAVIQTISKEIIPHLRVMELEYETGEDGTIAYALMELNPRQILDQLLDNEKLSPLFQTSLSFEQFNSEVIGYEASKETQAASQK